jgi:hypothetical protein
MGCSDFQDTDMASVFRASGFDRLGGCFLSGSRHVALRGWCRSPCRFPLPQSNHSPLDTENRRERWRVIVQRGWIAQTNQEMEIKNVEEVNVDQSFFGRLFGYGTIQIRGTGINSIVLQWIAAPYELRRAIELALQEQRTRPPTQNPRRDRNVGALRPRSNHGFAQPVKVLGPGEMLVREGI